MTIVCSSSESESSSSGLGGEWPVFLNVTSTTDDAKTRNLSLIRTEEGKVDAGPRAGNRALPVVEPEPEPETELPDLGGDHEGGDSSESTAPELKLKLKLELEVVESDSDSSESSSQSHANGSPSSSEKS